ncbi:MAG: hypothetical protein P4M00_17465 [Azospirillaceae bacterium]|nr:hypothetical protein [Azospirillaceae bacterium]
MSSWVHLFRVIPASRRAAPVEFATAPAIVPAAGVVRGRRSAG